MKRVVVTLLMLSCVLLAGCSKEAAPPGGSGLLETDESIVSAETTGKVMKFFFDEGSSVNAGDTLVEIDNTRLMLKLKSSLANQKAALSQLETSRLNIQQAEELVRFLAKEKQRISSLYNSGTVPQKQMDQIKHEYNQAQINKETAEEKIQAVKAELKKIEAEIAQIKRTFKDCFPTAPISGVITEKYVEIGELLTEGKPIVKVSNLRSLWVKVYLPMEDFANVKIGDKAVLDTEAVGKKYQGEIIWTSEEAEFTPKNVQTKKSRANLVYAVKIRVNNSDGFLKIGMPVYVTIGE